MSSLLRTLLLTLLSFMLPLVSCSTNGWYSLTCETGPTETITMDKSTTSGTGSTINDNGNGNDNVVVDDGDLFAGGIFDASDSISNGNNNGNESISQNGSERRSLRHSSSRPESLQSYIPIDVSATDTSTSSTPALPWPWMRETQEEQLDGDVVNSLSSIEALQENVMPQNDTQLQYLVRPCLCHPKNVHANFYGPNETIPELYLCPAAAEHCGIPFPGEGSVGCFTISVQEVVARNAWPLIMLWYFGMIVVCCCTIHGNNSWEYFRSTWNSRWNDENVDRLLLPNSRSPPASYWNWWAWQKYRLEQNLVAHSQWIWRHQESVRLQLRREQGLPPPQYEMKTKRFSRDQLGAENHDNDGDDGDDDCDSINEPTCTICFVPLNDGDLIGDLTCQHMFHKACLKSWCTRKNACPLCNIPFAKRRQETQRHDLSSTGTEASTQIQDETNTQNSQSQHNSSS